MLERSRDLLQRVDAFMASGEADPGHVSGELRLGVADSVVFKNNRAFGQPIYRLGIVRICHAVFGVQKIDNSLYRAGSALNSLRQEA